MKIQLNERDRELLDRLAEALDRQAAAQQRLAQVIEAQTALLLEQHQNGPKPAA